MPPMNYALRAFGVAPEPEPEQEPETLTEAEFRKRFKKGPGPLPPATPPIEQLPDPMSSTEFRNKYPKAWEQFQIDRESQRNRLMQSIRGGEEDPNAVAPMGEGGMYGLDRPDTGPFPDYRGSFTTGLGKFAATGFNWLGGAVQSLLPEGAAIRAGPSHISLTKDPFRDIAVAQGGKPYSIFDVDERTTKMLGLKPKEDEMFGYRTGEFAAQMAPGTITRRILPEFIEAAVKSRLPQTLLKSGLARKGYDLFNRAIVEAGSAALSASMTGQDPVTAAGVAGAVETGIPVGLKIANPLVRGPGAAMREQAEFVAGRALDPRTKGQIQRTRKAAGPMLDEWQRGSWVPGGQGWPLTRGSVTRRADKAIDLREAAQDRIVESMGGPEKVEVGQMDDIFKMFEKIKDESLGRGTNKYTGKKYWEYPQGQQAGDILDDTYQRLLEATQLEEGRIATGPLTMDVYDRFRKNWQNVLDAVGAYTTKKRKKDLVNMAHQMALREVDGAFRRKLATSPELGLTEYKKLDAEISIYASMLDVLDERTEATFGKLSSRSQGPYIAGGSSTGFFSRLGSAQKFQLAFQTLNRFFRSPTHQVFIARNWDNISKALLSGDAPLMSRTLAQVAAQELSPGEREQELKSVKVTPGKKAVYDPKTGTLKPR